MKEQNENLEERLKKQIEQNQEVNDALKKMLKRLDEKSKTNKETKHNKK